MSRSASDPVPSAEEQTPEKIRGMFSAITPAYDGLNHLFSVWLDHRWRRLAAREAVRGLHPCRRLLDLATGTGDLARQLAHAAGRKDPSIPSACHTSGPNRNEIAPKVLGIDFTRAMLKRAASKYGREPLNWIEGDGLRLPLADSCLDAVTIAFGLRNMADKAVALREMARVTRPGGRVVVLEFSQPRNPLLRALYELYLFTIMPRVGRWISGSEAYLYLARSIRSFWTPDQLSGQMRQAGLGPIRAIPLLMGTVYLHVGVKPVAK